MSEENKNFENNEGNSEDSSYTPVDMTELFCDEEPEKRRKGVPIPAFVLSLLAVMLAAVMITWTASFGFYRAALNDAVEPNIPKDDSTIDGAFISEFSYGLDVLKTFFDNAYYYEPDAEAQFEAVLKAYVAASGDRYAEYYTAEEISTLFAETEGKSEGIGIKVIDSTVMVGGYEYKAFKVIDVIKDSPAAEADLKVRDYIYSVYENEEYVLVDSLGYDPALAKLRGAAGTEAKFLVFRDNRDGTYEKIPFSITREAIINSSVMWHVCETDASVGIVKITSFDLTTPTQLEQAMDEFLAEGITKIVFDLRYNPGGNLDSIVAVLSRFVEEGKTIISASDRDGRTRVYTSSEVTDNEGAYASCNISREELGKYKDLNVAVVCNESTASAAELFVANFRDHDIGAVVGTTTYGKGSMQTIYDLSRYGMGGLRLTTNVYFPPSGESYDGIGITPDVVIELDEVLYEKNIYDITDAEDNQLQAAIKTFE